MLLIKIVSKIISAAPSLVFPPLLKIWTLQFSNPRTKFRDYAQELCSFRVLNGAVVRRRMESLKKPAWTGSCRGEGTSLGGFWKVLLCNLVCVSVTELLEFPAV